MLDMGTDIVSKGQLWKTADGSETARVLRIRMGSTNRRNSIVSMLGAEYVRYFNLRTRRQSEARIDVFRSKFSVFEAEVG